MIENLTLVMITLLIMKHFVIDFPMQGPYQYLNKGTYGHPGGILHAANHTAGTLFVLGFYLGGSHLLLILAIVEGIIHYHIDWAKVNICHSAEWKCNTSEWFWYMVGFDQLLHYLTYVGMVLVYTNYAI